jgi:hypothetical protein
VLLVCSSSFAPLRLTNFVFNYCRYNPSVGNGCAPRIPRGGGGGAYPEAKYNLVLILKIML